MGVLSQYADEYRRCSSLRKMSSNSVKQLWKDFVETKFDRKRMLPLERAEIEYGRALEQYDRQLTAIVKKLR